LINMNRDLLGAALGGNMLGACQRRPATVAGKPEEILRHERYGASRAPLPRRVSRRIDDNLTHDSPTSMVRIATRNQESRQRLGYPHSSGLRPVTVQVPQCGTHFPAALDRPGELPGGPPRLACLIIDPSTVLDPEGRPPFGASSRRSGARQRRGRFPRRPRLSGPAAPVTRRTSRPAQLRTASRVDPAIGSRRASWFRQQRGRLAATAASPNDVESEAHRALLTVEQRTEGLMVADSELWHFKMYRPEPGQSFHEQ
jgi:hypothetical protein